MDIGDSTTRDGLVRVIFHSQTPSGLFQILKAVPEEPSHDNFKDYQRFFASYMEEFGEMLAVRIPDRCTKIVAKLNFSVIKRPTVSEEDNEQPPATDAPQIIENIWATTRAHSLIEDMNGLMSVLAQELSREIQNFAYEQSGYSFLRVKQFVILCAKYSLRPSPKGRCEVPPALPKAIPRRSYVNLLRYSGRGRSVGINLGENCFIDAITIAAFLAEDSSSGKIPSNSAFPSSWRKCIDSSKLALNFSDGRLKSPDGVATSMIYIFENLNPDYYVTVLTARDNGDVNVIRSYNYEQYKKAEERGRKHILLFLLLYKEHYFPVTNINTLLRKPDNRHSHFCSYCLHSFITKGILDRHMESCNALTTRKVIMPPKGETAAFRPDHVIKCQTQPIVVYADTEALHYYHDNSTVGSPPKVGGSSTRVVDTHVPFMVGYYISISKDFEKVLLARRGEAGLHFPEYPNSLYQEFYGENCMSNFLESLVDLQDRLYRLTKYIKLPFFRRSDYLLQLNTAKLCHICQREILRDGSDPGLSPVLDHDHWTGLFRGVAHATCNSALRQKKRELRIIMHNFRGYDCHALCKHAKFSSVRKFRIGTIPQTTEKYLSMTLDWTVDSFIDKETGKVVVLMNRLIFIDSLQHLSSSLEALVQQLESSGGDSFFRHLKYGFVSNELYLLCKRKGVYPYEYMDSFAKLTETKLPSIEDFTSRLKGPISNGDYDHACRVWKVAGCKSLKDYSSLYMKVDVLTLADVFDKFRSDCLQSYNMDPVFFYSLPGFAWAAMLRMCSVDLEKISDYEMFCTFEQGIRGGVSAVSKHYTKADNYYTNPEKFSSPDSADSTYVCLLDANGLYSWAMTQPLPYAEFKWVEDLDALRGIFTDDVGNWPDDNGNVGYILTVDLAYPEALHDLTASYPLAPAHERVALGDFSLSMLHQWLLAYPEKSSIKAEYKLVGSCRTKKFYVCHYRELKFYVKMGMEIEKIHAAISFKQAPFMKEYIDYNIEQRKANSSDKLKSDLFKKLNNAVYGKTQEQQRKHMNFKLSSEEVEQLRLVARDSYLGSVVYQEDLVGFHMQKDRVVLRHPIYIGMTVLGLSKILMFRFFYDVLKPLFGEDMTLCYTDTDSLLLEIRGSNVPARLASISSEWIDGSNLPVGHPLYSMQNKGKLGYFKDEMDGVHINEAVILRPKMYSISCINGTVKKRAKGIKQSVVKSQFTFDDYERVFRSCVIEEGGNSSRHPDYVTQTNFRSRRHEIQTIEQRKKSLALFDNKRYWTDNVDSLPFGHYRAVLLQEGTVSERADLLLDRLNLRLEDEGGCDSQCRGRQRRPYQYPDEYNKSERLFDEPSRLVKKRKAEASREESGGDGGPITKRRRKSAHPRKVESGLS